MNAHILSRYVRDCCDNHHVMVNYVNCHLMLSTGYARLWTDGTDTGGRLRGLELSGHSPRAHAEGENGGSLRRKDRQAVSDGLGAGADSRVRKEGSSTEGPNLSLNTVTPAQDRHSIPSEVSP